jgi:hypothetical protein
LLKSSEETSTGATMRNPIFFLFFISLSTTIMSAQRVAGNLIRPHRKTDRAQGIVNPDISFEGIESLKGVRDVICV